MFVLYVWCGSFWMTNMSHNTFCPIAHAPWQSAVHSNVVLALDVTGSVMDLVLSYYCHRCKTTQGIAAGIYLLMFTERHVD